MDQYTLMCSKLEELQREWKPETGDKYWRYALDVTIESCPNDHHKHYGQGKFIVGCGDKDPCGYQWCYSTVVNDPDVNCVWLPSLEQMIGMMPLEIYWVRIDAWKKNGYFAFLYEKPYHDKLVKSFDGESINIAMLQALAWARWGKEWDKEKGEWKDADKNSLDTETYR